MIEFVGKILKSIRKSLRRKKESASLVYYFLFVYTLILLLMFIGEALAKCETVIKYRWQTPFEAVLVYFNILSAYIFNKELLDRWLSHLIWNQKPGEFLVLLWGLALTILFLAQFFSEGKIQPPANMILVFQFVLSGLVGSEISKKIYYRRHSNRRENRGKIQRKPTYRAKSSSV